MKNKFLTIGIDISEIASAKKTGSEIFALNLITNILKIDNKNIYVSLNHLGPIYCPVKYVTVILDLSFITNRETFKKIDELVFKIYAQRALSISNNVIAISQSTKRDIT